MTAIRQTIKNIPQTSTDPLINYRQTVGQVESKLNIEEIIMSQLILILDKMAPTTSTTADYISVKLLKSAGSSLNPLLLHLMNSVIKTQVFPEALKVTKIIPIRKMEKT